MIPRVLYQGQESACPRTGKNGQSRMTVFCSKQAGVSEMKKLLSAVAIALGILSAAHGQTTTFHDAAGRVTGKAVQIGHAWPICHHRCLTCCQTACSVALFSHPAQNSL